MLKYKVPTWGMLVKAIDREAGENNPELAKKITSDHPSIGMDYMCGGGREGGK